MELGENGPNIRHVVSRAERVEFSTEGEPVTIHRPLLKDGIAQVNPLKSMLVPVLPAVSCCHSYKFNFTKCWNSFRHINRNFIIL